MIETALRRDRIVAIAALTLVTVLAWAWTLSAARMPIDGGMPGMAVGSRAAWSAGHAVLMFAMWWIMMVAMMLPSAAPFVLLGLSLHRREGGAGRSTAALMASGYLGVWGLFSVGATLAQWGLDAAGLLSAGSVRTGPALAGAILVAAGVYQLTPAKRACLKQCRSPVQFVVEHWHPGAVGAVRMGVAHGTYCLGCCWLLMGMLFAVGVMNPFWIGALALWVLVEKWSPYGDRLRYVAGALLIFIGAFIILRLLWIS